jgi:hypothetical protein
MAANRAAERRLKIRDAFWKDAEQVIWSRLKVKGFITVPRLLSLACALIKELADDDPTSVYVDLWCRVWDEGLVESVDENDCAFSSGYVGSRAKRTWTDHMWQLQGLGFIRIAPDGNSQIGHVLMLDPIKVCHDLHERGKVSDEWWAAFVRRAGEIGAALPSDSGTPPAEMVVTPPPPPPPTL